MRFSPLLSLPLLLLSLALLLPAARVAPHTIGHVRDDEGNPVSGALVRYKGTSFSTHTDTAGRFTLPQRKGRFTAWKDGHLIAGGKFPSLHLERLPRDDNEAYTWIDPTPDLGDDQRCGNCHTHIHDEWARSGHSRSVTGRRFRDLYDDLLLEHPNGSGVCSSCHAPTVRDDDPALFDLRQVKGVDALGVHCDFCHKVSGPGEGQVGLTHGRFFLQLLRPAKGQLFFGPLDDVDRGEDAYSPFYRDSRYCAACHEGTVFGVAVYTTYSEWLNSPARRQGKHCQHCHMKPTGKLHNIAPDHGGIGRDPKTLGNHAFWDESQESMLRRCLRLEVSQQGRSLTVRLTASGVGHSVPTGFIDRQLLLIVEPMDRDGRPVSITGPTLPAVAGDFAGKAGRLYARLLKDEEDKSPVPFWRALPEPDDTRLSPDTPDVRSFILGEDTASVRVRVIHRRFWAATTKAKRWPRADIVVIDRVTRVSRR